MRLDPLRDKHPVSDQRRTRFTASYLRGFRLLKKGIFPTARLHATSNQSIITATETGVLFDAVTWDRGGDDAESHADFLMAEVASNRLKIRIPGIYSVTATIRWAGNSTGTRELRVLVNGTIRLVDNRLPPDVLAGLHSVTGLFELTVDDTIVLLVVQTSGGNLNLIGTDPNRPSLAAVWVAQ